MRHVIIALAALCAPMGAAHAQSLSASDPAGIVTALKDAGYSPSLDKDSYGDPIIGFELAGYDTEMMFYGCDEETHDRCDSVQLRAGFDREQPWTATEALKISKAYRFVSIWLDEDGDPWVQWDIVTGQGIPAPVFLKAIESFGETLEDTAEMVFKDE